MKGTSISGWAYGPFLSGTNAQDGEDSMDHVLANVKISGDIEWLLRKKEFIEFDKMMATRRGETYTEVDPEDFTQEELLQEWYDYQKAPLAQKIKNKIWYLMLDSFDSMIANWTFTKTKIKATKRLLSKVVIDAACEESGGEDDGDVDGKKVDKEVT